jgi:hypothetical protein
MDRFLSIDIGMISAHIRIYDSRMARRMLNEVGMKSRFLCRLQHEGIGAFGACSRAEA